MTFLFGILGIACFSSMSFAREITINLEGKEDVLKRTWGVNVCFYDTNQQSYCVSWASQYGLGTNPSAKKLNLDDSINIDRCFTLWGAPMILPEDRRVRKVLYPLHFSSGGGMSGHDGVCQFDSNTNTATAFTEYTFDKLSVETHPSAFKKKNAFLLSLKLDVTPPSSCGTECDEYSETSGIINRTENNEEFEVLVFSVQDNSYRLSQKWFVGQRDPIIEPVVEFQGSKEITLK